MTAQFQPAPTWALPIIVDPTTGEAVFNPIWLNWFLLLGQQITNLSAWARTTLVLNVAGNTSITLTAGQASNAIIEFTGTLTGNISITMPDQSNYWILYNNTSGNYTLTIKGPADAGLVLEQTFRGIFYYNGAVIARANDPAIG